jgi:hypothetical protein
LWREHSERRTQTKTPNSRCALSLFRGDTVCLFFATCEIRLAIGRGVRGFVLREYAYYRHSAVTIYCLFKQIQAWALGAVVARTLCMRDVVGSIPTVSNSSLFCEQKGSLRTKSDALKRFVDGGRGRGHKEAKGGETVGGRHQSATSLRRGRPYSPDSFRPLPNYLAAACCQRAPAGLFHDATLPEAVTP